MRTSRRFRRLCLAITLCAAAPGAKPAKAPLEQQTEQKLDPLSKDDSELYLKVMRAAAGRVKNPAPADQAAPETAKKILAGSASGRVPTPDDVKTLERANLTALSIDQVVAEEMKIDARTYRGIAEAIESVVQNPAPDHPPTPLEKRLRDVNAANQEFLKPYIAEIQKLMAIVHNPANLPK